MRCFIETHLCGPSLEVHISALHTHTHWI